MTGRSRPAGPVAASRASPGLRLARCVGIGLLAGVAFTLPIVVFLRTLPGSRRTLLLLVAAVAAVLIVRRAGRLLRRMLEAAPLPWRLPLLGLYAASAMLLPASLLLAGPGPAAVPARHAAPPAR